MISIRMIYRIERRFAKFPGELQSMRDIVVLMTLIPGAVIAWNQPKWQKRNFWPLIKYFPVLFIFASLLAVGLLVPSDIPDAAKDKLGRRLLIEVVIGELIIAGVYVVILFKAEYGDRGWRTFWSDLKARVFGNDVPKK
jgi:hypothetical protein